MIVAGDGTLYGTIGGGTVEAEVIRDAKNLMGNKQPLLKTYAANDQSKDQNISQITLFLESIGPTPILAIFGAGHVGRALASLSKGLGLMIVLMDERPEIMEGLDLTGVDLRQGKYEALAMALDPGQETYVIICTHDHALDELVLRYTASKPFSFIGMVASRRKAEKIKAHLLESGRLTIEQIENVEMPVGLNIASETPAEIAVSIMGRLIQHKNQAGAKPLNDAGI